MSCQGPPSKSKPIAGDAFEDVLYGSESELESSDDEEPSRAGQHANKRGSNTGGARLRADNDEPMDLLAGAASRITSTYSPPRQR